MQKPHHSSRQNAPQEASTLLDVSCTPTIPKTGSTSTACSPDEIREQVVVLTPKPHSQINYSASKRLGDLAEKHARLLEELKVATRANRHVRSSLESVVQVVFSSPQLYMTIETWELHKRDATTTKNHPPAGGVRSEQTAVTAGGDQGRDRGSSAAASATGASPQQVSPQFALHIHSIS